MICPECGKEYTAHPAVSRKDNTTPICTDCGIRQSLAPVIDDPEEIERVIGVVHRYAPEQTTRKTHTILGN